MSADFAHLGTDHRDLLHALGYLYLQHGHNRRALVLLLLADRLSTGDPGVKRSLAYAFVANRAGGAALGVIDELEARGQGQPALRLLRSRALLLEGRREEARLCFRAYVNDRRRVAA